MERQALWTKDFWKICFSSFFLFMTFYILATTLPVFVTDELKGNQQQIGLVMTVLVIASVILRPLTGRWIDRFGRAVFIRISLALLLIVSVLYIGVGSIGFLLILRVVHGAGFGMATTAAGAVATDLVPEERKGEGIGYYSMFMSLAMVIGPFVGLTLIHYFSFKVLFAMCCVFAVLSFACGIWTRIPKHTGHAVKGSATNGESSYRSLRADAGGKKEPSMQGWKSFIEPKAVPISLAALILAFAYSGITTFISVYANEMSLGNVSSYFFVCFAIMIVLFRPFVGRIFDRYGENMIVYPAIAIFVVGMIFLSQAHSALVFLISGAIIGLGYGALMPSFQTLAVQLSPHNRRGLATSTYFLLFDLGYGIGSYLLGVIAAHTHYHTMYLISAIIVAFTSVFYYVLHQRKRIGAVKPSKVI